MYKLLSTVKQLRHDCVFALIQSCRLHCQGALCMIALYKMASQDVYTRLAACLRPKLGPCLTYLLHHTTDGQRLASQSLLVQKP